MKQILCFGDSNTYGLIPGTKARYDWNIRWSGILGERMRPYGYRVVEEGLCGRTTVFDDLYRDGRNASKMLQAILETHDPIDRIILMLGTNDCKSAYNATPEDIGAGIELLLEQIEIFAPEASVLLLSPIYLGERVWQAGYDEEFDKKSVEVSRRLGDVYEQIAAHHGISFLRAADYAHCSGIDEEHLDAEGHSRLAEAVYNKILRDIISEAA